MALSVSITEAPAVITDLAVDSVSAGGSLAASTQYYYIAVPIRNVTYPLFLNRKQTAYSGVSNEVSGTTTADNKTITLSWTDTVTPIGGDPLTGVLIFRRTAAQPYYNTSSCRLYISDPSKAIVAAGVETLVDDGETGYYPTVLSVLPPTPSTLPCGFDPRTIGAIACQFWGDTSTYDLEDLYDVIADSHPDHVYYDGNTFGLMGSLYTHDSNQIILTDYERVWYQFGPMDFTNSHASSLFTFGTIYSSRAYLRLSMYLCYGYYMPNFIAYKTYLYGTNLKFSTLTGYDGTVVSGGSLSIGAGCKIIGVFGAGGSTNLTVDATVFVSGYTNLSQRLTGTGTSDFKLLQNITISYVLAQSVGTDWISDRFTFIDIFAYDVVTTTESVAWIVGSSWPNILYSATNKGLPEIYWRATVPSSTKVYVGDEFICRASDEGVAIEGATLSLTYGADLPLPDRWGDDVTALESDANGYFWKEKLTFSGTPTTTVLPCGSPGWDVSPGIDGWKGCLLYWEKNDTLYGPIKILSNTANTLTLCEALPAAPSSGDLGGIVLWIPWGYLNHKSGTGAGYGATYTDYTLYNPITVTVSKTGYNDFSSPETIRGATKICAALSTGGGGGVSPTQYGLVPLGVKQGVV